MEEMPKPHALPGKDRAETSCQFKGIRFRKWGSWVSEIRMPRSRQKLWLGSYNTAERAARAYDAALYCLRGPNATFNFPGSVPNIPSASSLSRHQIKLAAAKHAHMDPIPSISPSAHNNDENGSANKEKKAAARKDSVSPSRPASGQERVSLSDGGHQQEDELALLWESLLPELGDCLTQSLEQLPSIEEAWALNPMPSPIPSWEEQHHEQYEEEDMRNFLQLTDPWALNPISSPIPSWEEQHHEQYEEDMNNFLQLTDLWNFRDV